MHLTQLLERCKPLCAVPDVEITAVTADSRQIVPGCAFVCIEGARFDGHLAAQAAVEAGARAVVAQRDTGVPCQVLVEDTRQAYALMCAAQYGYPAEKLRLVGITGTNGKTTTSYLLKSILEQAGQKVGLIGTVQNMIGDEIIPAQYTTPDPNELHGLFDRMVREGCDTCVMEVSSQALAQGRVVGCRFEQAVFTNLTQDHLDYHGSFANYIAAKRILFENAAHGVVNLDDSYVEELLKGTDCACVTFSSRQDAADYTAKNINLKSDGVEYELVGRGVIGRVRLGIPGAFSIYNSMGAAVCAVEMGVPFQDVIRALASSKGVKGRIEVVPTDTDYTVIIDYAHSPDGLENILTALNEIKQGRLIAVFGCGGDRDRTKRPQMGAIAARLADVAVVTSDNPRTEEPEAIVEDVLEGMRDAKIPVEVEVDRTRAIRRALDLARPGDIVLLAGKGHETYQILHTGKIHYDEREVVAALLAEKEDR